jgi:alpha-beta hydrolase superfamily lysophospholipase
MRLGAALLAAGAESAAFDALVYWHPVVSGRSFLREQHALYVAACGDLAGEHESPAMPGYSLPVRTREEISKLTLTERAAVAAPSVVVVSDPASPSHQLLSSLLSGADAVPAVEPLERVFDVGEVSFRHSEEAVAQVAGILDERAPRERRPLARSSRAEVEVEVAAGGAGGRVLERPRRLGPHELFGIETFAEDAREATPVVLFLSVAGESSIGPGRQWVDLARRYASAGVRSVRFDLSGIGESPTRPGREERLLYVAHALDDIVEAAAAVSTDDPSDVILVGMCSGAFAALAVAPRLRPRGVVAINPLLRFAAFAGTTDDRNGSAPPAGGLVEGMVRGGGESARLQARVSSFAAGLPPAVWALAARLRLIYSPARILDPIVDGGIATMIVAGRGEADIPLRRSPAAVRRLRRSENCRFSIVPGLQHSLLDAASRAAVQRELADFLGPLVGASLAGPAAPAAAEVRRARRP